MKSFTTVRRGLDPAEVEQYIRELEATLSKKDLDDIINDGESIEVKCQFCNKAYEFSVEELKELRK